jgi:hypothetical protein
MNSYQLIRSIGLVTCFAMLALPSVRVEAADQACDAYQTVRTKWLTNMSTYGRQWGEYIAPASTASYDSKLDAVYYDGQWVFQQIGAHLKQTSPWNTYAEHARQIYVENYLEPGFGAQGYRRFPHGIYFDYLTGGNSTLLDITRLRDNPAFSRLAEYSGAYLGTNQNMSRELAYAIQANIYAERAGQARIVENGVQRLPRMVQWTESHFAQWKSGRYESADPDKRFAPFMAALLMHALIEWIEWEETNGRDPNASWNGTNWASIDDMLVDFLFWMRDSSKIRSGSLTGQSMWVTTNGRSTFRYQDIGEGENVAAGWDLGNLSSYSYAWTSRRLVQRSPSRSADASRLMLIADDLFMSNVDNGWLAGRAKQFNQSYRLSFGYVAIKDASNIGYCGSESITVPRPPVSVTAE